MEINIDKKIDKRLCPCPALCTVATTGYSEQEREHQCYLCWKKFCEENKISIKYS